MPEPAAAGTVLGFDFGSKRIGVAIGNTVTGTARPLQVVNAGPVDWARIAALAAEWQPIRLVVGLPLNMDGSESELSAAARRFGNRLNGRLGLPVTMVDERLSSFEARGEQLRGQAGNKLAVDALAATLILETWLGGQSAKR